MSVAKKRTELFVGVFIFIGLTLLGGLILQFGSFKERLRGQYALTIVFDDASGVIKGSEVRMGGAAIGEVSSLPQLNEAVKVEVDLSIKNSIQIPKGSIFQINSATLLGDKLIVVIPPDDRSHGSIQPGSRLEGAGPTGLDAIQNNAEIVTRDVKRIIKEAEETLTKIDAAVDDIRGASKQLGESLAKINSSLLADENLARFDSTLENLSNTSEKWKVASDKLDPTLTEAREAIAAFHQAAAGAERTFKNADQTLAEAKPALSKLPKAVDQFSATTEKAGKALDRMAKGEGMLGALATDNDVALDFKAFMRNLRQHGIFRYKDSVGKAEKPKDPPPKLGGRNR
jgi:virulence factor Mce-like protein